jgi:thiol:disulfide interchange protein
MKGTVMPEQPITITDGPEDRPHNPHSAWGWLSRHRSSLLWLGVLAVIVVLQWPMLKGWGYQLMGSPVPDDGIAWRSDYRAALAEAQQTGKPVLLDFSASWCPPCQVMKHDVWPDPKVRQAVNDGYIPVAVDVDAAGNQEVANRYGISTIPSIVIVNAKGQVLKQGSFMSRSALLAFLADPKQG